MRLASVRSALAVLSALAPLPAWSRRPLRSLPLLAAAVALGAALLGGCNWPPGLRDEKEVIYGFLSDGDAAAAKALLEDVWDLGQRSEPVRIHPLDWTAGATRDSYWRFIFYSLRPTSNLLWAYNRSGDRRYRDKLLEILRSYVAFDALRTGLDRETFDNRHSAAFRAMVLVNTYFKLRRAGGLPDDLEPDLRAAIYRLGDFLEKKENFETGQNHGFNEASALLLIAANFPEAPRAGAWEQTALARLVELMKDAVDEDGVQIENSPFYHFYVLTFVLQIDAWARRYDVPVPPAFSEKFGKMIRYATYITQPDGHLPLMGASVDYDVPRTDPEIYAAVGEDDPAFEFVRTLGQGGSAPAARAAVFPVSGQVIVRSAFSPTTSGGGFARDAHLVFSAGPYRTSHSHLDRLGLNYFAAGRPLLVDSGLFTYDPGPDFDYFHGTAAHNTVVVDGKDQAEGSGALGLVLHEEGQDWTYQSGRHGLYEGVRHGRGVLQLGPDLLLVIDALRADAEHDYDQMWHLAPDLIAEVDARDGQSVLGRPAPGQAPVVRVRPLQPVLAGPALVRGQQQPLLGWYSQTYGKKLDAPVASYRARGKAASLLTLVTAGARAEAPLPAQVGVVDNTLSVCVAGRLVRVTGTVGGEESVSVSTADSCP